MAFSPTVVDVYENFWFSENCIFYWKQNSCPCLLVTPQALSESLPTASFFSFSLTASYSCAWFRFLQKPYLPKHPWWCSHCPRGGNHISWLLLLFGPALLWDITDIQYSTTTNAFVCLFLNSGKVQWVFRTDGEYITVIKNNISTRFECPLPFNKPFHLSCFLVFIAFFLHLVFTIA